MEKIKLGEFRSINSLNEDINLRLDLNSNKKQIIEYNINNILDLSNLFNVERQNIDKYQIYGSIEYLSILNNLKENYEKIEDFFGFRDYNYTKNIFNSFKFYLLIPNDEYEKIEILSNNDEIYYIKKYKVISNLSDFEIYNAGFSLNLFGEQKYTFNFNDSYDINGIRDGIQFPITKFYLYCDYIPSTNGISIDEIVEKNTFDLSGNTNIVQYTPSFYDKNDIIDGELIIHKKKEFEYDIIENIQHYIYTSYSGDTGIEEIRWKYNPFIEIKIKDYDINVLRENKNSLAYEDVLKIPDYATEIDNNGNFVWKNVLDKGFIDPITGLGTIFPFVNNKHYVFNNIILNIKPDLTHPNTNIVFNEINLGEDIPISSSILNNSINDINKLCK